ncbi:pheromone-regulated membrane protein 10 [[Candida] jaroonii]|uniref:Pheromone-regulated membrane protein 10 n=1 Tax=[Candida] jaroonii TaxID=467808 RepID=A0ACA9Y3A2_9ASCO|nr:pheromone-regulated membrane protein 10 [[Candida] jaroonii]
MSSIHDSSDEERDFQSHIQLPSLQDYQKHKKRNSSSTNLVKAGKKFGKAIQQKGSSSKKGVNSPRQSFVSNDSSLNEPEVYSDSSDDYQEGSSSLPKFQFKDDLNAESNVMDDDEDEGMYPEYGDDYDTNLPDHLDESDSDDDELNRNPPPQGLDPLDQPTHDLHQHASRDSHESRFSHNSLHSKSDLKSHSSRNSSLRNHIFRRPSMFSRKHGETDITDQLGSTTSSHTANSQNRSGVVFKDILRKMALQDQAYPERPNSDTFIGQILSNDGNMSLSGGGLVPGGSRMSREKPIDEEEEIGDDESFAERNSIELQKLDFAQLNNEARNLINVHVPERYRQETFEDHQIESNSSSETVKEKSDEIDEKARPSIDSKTRKKEADLYAPNPDLFLRNDVQYNDDGEFMMLDEDSEYNIAPPTKVQAGVLSSLLKLYQNPDESKSTSSLSYGDHSTLHEFDEDREPTKTSSSFDIMKGFKSGGKMVKDNLPFYKKTHSGQQTPVDTEDGQIPITDESGMPSFQNAKPKQHRKAMVNPSNVPTNVSKRFKKAKKKAAEQLRITVHIADVLQRQRFIMLMCKALMLFGAPTHRLEEYMIMTSRVLEIDGQFIYFPGCMIMAFGDAATRTSEVHLVKCTQGLNLSKLDETHKIYKAVIHDLMGAEEASVKLTKILKSKNVYNPWLCVFFYGLGSSMVCPFAFGGGWTDIPIAFGVGLCVGYLQFFVSSMSNLYSSVFEVSASIVVSFIARAIGSIHGGKIFCFSAIAQGSLALILPGYIILCGSLELQSRNLVAGAVRMFYAIIYSLFLGFGITLGASLYGWVDKNSVSEVTCSADHQIDPKFRILFVPAFATSLGLINQAKLKQLPVMLIIACTGYVGTYFAGLHFSNVSEFTACIGAFIVGILGNLYSRIWKGLAVSAMLPAIFVQVPSGIASQSSLLSGITAANAITSDGNNTTASNAASDSSSGSMSFGSAMVEVSIGISVGLFAAALIVYPFGKKKTGLFSL